MSVWLRLMYEFCKTGLFSVGGGLATLPFLYEMGEKTGWFTNHDILNILAVSESTPGAIGINMATYVGYITTGPLGGILATIALSAPSVVVIILVARVLEKFKGSKVVDGVFKTLRPASIGLITAAGLQVAKMAFLDTEALSELSLTSIFSAVNWLGIVLAVLVFWAMRKYKKHPIVYILFSAIIGILLKF